MEHNLGFEAVKWVFGSLGSAPPPPGGGGGVEASVAFKCTRVGLGGYINLPDDVRNTFHIR